MATLKAAHRELFKRGPDETFGSLEALHEHCRGSREQAREIWQDPREVAVETAESTLGVGLGREGTFRLNDWSFSQVCRLSGVNQDTVNRLSLQTAERVHKETLQRGGKPLQFLCEGQRVRSLHGTAYTRLWNADVLDVVREAACDFQPPQEAAGGGTGLYAGEQDVFAFMIDPTGWIDVEGESFAPGFFVVNSEVGRRSLGNQTFWWQQNCSNHIVWDATDVCEFTRKHTANVHDGLAEIAKRIEALVAKGDARKDAFADVIAKAAKTPLAGHGAC